MFSVCRTSAAAVPARRALLTKCQLRLLLWEFGDPGSTLGKAQPPLSLRELSVRAGAADGEPGRVGPAGENTATCWVLSLPSFVPVLLPWEWQNLVGHSRRMRGAQCGQAGMVGRMRMLLSSGRALWSRQVAEQQDGAGRSSSTSPALRTCSLQDESPKAACELGPWDWQFAGLPAKPPGQMFPTSLKNHCLRQ